MSQAGNMADRDRSSRRKGGEGRGPRAFFARVVGSLGMLGCLALLSAAPAAATQTHLFKETFGPVQQPSFRVGPGVGSEAPDLGAGTLTTIQSSGDLLVANGSAEKAKISRFKANGEPDPFSALGTNAIDGAKGPGGKPCAEEPASCDATPLNALRGLRGSRFQQIAVDESTGPAAGDIYVLEEEANQVNIFAADGHYLGRLNKCGTEKFGEATGLALDPSGNVYIGDNTGGGLIHKFTPVANPPVAANCSLANDLKVTARPGALAMGSGPTAGYLFVIRATGGTSAFNGAVLKVKLSTGEVAYPVLEDQGGQEGSGLFTIAVDPANGHLFVARKGTIFTARTEEYDASGSSSAVRVSTTPFYPSGIAFAKVGGDIYLSNGGEHVSTYDAAIVTQPAVETLAATGVTPSKAVLHGTVDPDGVELTECVFEYVNEFRYTQNGNAHLADLYTGGHSVPCSETPAEIGSSHGPVAVDAAFSEPINLSRPNYVFRLVAANSNGVQVFGENQTFETKHVAITEPASAITGTTATLNGTVNPDGAEVTECQFEYLPSASFVREVQTVTLHGATGGTFRLGFGGEETVGQGEGKLSPESTMVSEVSSPPGHALVVGALITGTGIKPGTTIASYDPQNLHIITLSQPTEAVVPSGRTALTGELTSDLPASSVGEALNAVPAVVSAGGLDVSGEDGGPYTITFRASANFPQLSADASGLTPSGAEVSVATQTQGNGLPEGTIVPCAESAGEIGTGETPVAVHADVSGLQRGTEYRYRLTAANAVDGQEHARSSLKEAFTTLLEANVETKPATSLGGTVATLNGTVKPGGEPVTECSFAYVAASEYEPSTSDPYVRGGAVPCAESEAEIGTGSSAVPVHADIVGLEPATSYHFHLVANPNGTSLDGGDLAFVTGGPLIEAQWAASVGAAEATLAAAINPKGSATTYHLEYGKEGGPFEAVTAESESIGAGSSPATVEVHIAGLSQGTGYRYRFVAASHCNPLESAEACVTNAVEGSFRTATTQPEAPQSCPNEGFRGGASGALPDCRAYEMVSPVDKNGGNVGIHTTNYSQASLDGDRMTFAAIKPFAGAEAGPFESEYVSTRVEGAGWQTKAINPPRNSFSLYALGFMNFQFKAFSPDLCSGWFIQDTPLVLTEGAPPGLPNLYRRDLCGSGGYELLTTAPAPSFHPEYVETAYYPEPGGFSADGTRTVFRANDALTPDAAPEASVDPGHKNTYQIYLAQQGGPLRLVSLLPSSSSAAGQASALSSSIGTRTNTANVSEPKSDNVVGAVSRNAERVFWTATGENHGEGPGTLYLRVNATESESAHDSTGRCIEPTKACTYPVSELVAPQQSQFWQANPDGGRAIFSVEFSASKNNLYEFIAKEGPEGLETEARLIAEGFRRFMGASDDVGHVYFVSTKALAGDASAGESNLYLYERGGGFKFVGALSVEDGLEGEELKSSPPSPASIFPSKRMARVSPDGATAAFTSSASLTGYDNAATNAGGHPAGEVYVYDADADGGAGKLLCASCDPSGVRPVASLLGSYLDGEVQVWSAAEIPGWSSEFQPTHALSENGRRLFFNSYDALLPQDSNGAEDVYEWEAPGEGSCTEASSAYFAENGGCLYLISTGKSQAGSEFFDATAEGKDAFFSTLSSLLPQDKGLIDVYDARANGGLPESAGPSPSCEGEACQGPYNPPNDSTPSSSSFEGPGNVAKAAAKPCPKGKVRHKGRCVKKARKHTKRHKRHKRAANRKQEVAR